MSKKKTKKGHVGRKILFGVEIIVLLLLVGILFVYTQINKRMDNLNLDEGEDLNVQINESVAGSEVLSGYTNIALFGVDKRTGDEGLYGNSDTAIIASINNDTKEVRLVSLYRDTYLRVDEDSEGNGIYNKCNSAYLRGGPEQAINMLNTNLDLDIENYVSVDFSAMATVVDCLGGLDIPLTYQEIIHTNNHCVETSEQTGIDYTPIEIPDPKPEDETAIVDTYHLNGVQVTAYCRIRQTLSGDMGRTERQRLVLKLLTEKAKSAGLGTLNDILDQVFPLIQTNFSKSELIRLGMNIFNYSMGENTGFPVDYVMGADLTVPATGLDCVIPTTLETNVKYLHEFLFSDEDYQTSDIVKIRSDFIVQNTGFGESYVADERKYLLDDGETSSEEAAGQDESSSQG
ncbi:MAG TPA: LCP family protein [Candidatus Blautia merdipullorum]|nr:LCP family protein [Candidatus Blautia merdipullorum]